MHNGTTDNETILRGATMNKAIASIISEARKSTGCNIQCGGCPCNSDFHTWAEDELKLNKHLAHALWLIVLQHRGDYTKEEIDESTIEWENEVQR